VTSTAAEPNAGTAASGGRAITAILITRNEEQNLPRCLTSLRWAGEIVVVDSLSTDRTVEIASSHGCRVLTVPWQGYGPAKQIAIDAATHDWIFWIDADEEVPAALRAEILALPALDDHDAYDVSRKTFFLGRWIRHCGWYPARVTRLFDRRCARMGEQILHETIEMDRPHRLGHLHNDLLHYAYSSVQQYFAKMNDYGMDGARELARRGVRFSPLQLVLHPAGAFLKTYLLKLGILDGAAGLIISVGSAFSNFIKYTNLYYLSKG
jgi:(heptosyl)LPS beta-1,4-glucosyltransferase